MMRIRLLRATDITAECEACAARVDLVTGGACPGCRRVLCARHLHGSWMRRLLVDLGASPLCLSCRAGARERAS